MRAPRRFRLRRPSRFGEWYLAGAILLTLAWLLARSLAPAGGLTRSYYHPLPRDANPPALDTSVVSCIKRGLSALVAERLASTTNLVENLLG